MLHRGLNAHERASIFWSSTGCDHCHGRNKSTVHKDHEYCSHTKNGGHRKRGQTRERYNGNDGEQTNDGENFLFSMSIRESSCVARREDRCEASAQIDQSQIFFFQSYIVSEIRSNVWDHCEAAKHKKYRQHHGAKVRTMRDHGAHRLESLERRSFNRCYVTAKSREM